MNPATTAALQPDWHRRYPFSLVVLILLAIISLSGAGHSRQSSQRMPANAEAKSYGNGWECKVGFRRDGNLCKALEIPANAFGTGSAYGRGWECLRGFSIVRNSVCQAITVPSDAYLNTAGNAWRCNRGYLKSGRECRKIKVPENGYLTESTLGSGWACERGFRARASECEKIIIPENAYQTNSAYGTGWVCDRGFRAANQRCEAIIVPTNAYLVDSEYGQGWKCERGFKKNSDACSSINLPDNAHLDRSGNDWECNRSYERTNSSCVKSR